MAKAHKKINMAWSPKLSYAIGIIASDGNLSPDRRHINITSKDLSIVESCKSALEIDNKIGRKSRERSSEKEYYVLQFGSVLFYQFLLDLGLHPNKSKTLKKVDVPNEYFSHFLRGLMNGDGTITSFKHPYSKLLQTRISLASASPDFLIWIHGKIRKLVNIEGGWIYNAKKKNISMLTFGKRDTILVCKFMYNKSATYKLMRKYDCIEKYL